MGPRYHTAEDGLGMPAVSAAVNGIVSSVGIVGIVGIMAERAATGTQRTSRWAEGISGADDGLTDEDDIGAAAREAHDIVRASDSSGGDPHDLRRQNVSDLVEQAAVDGQGVGITGVDGHDAGPRIDCGQRLTAGTDLDNGAHPQGVHPLDESFEHEGLKAGVEHEQIGAVSPGLVHLVGRDHQVVGEDGKIHGGPDCIQVLEGASRGTRPGDH